jgi:hypothetical protein
VVSVEPQRGAVVLSVGTRGRARADVAAAITTLRTRHGHALQVVHMAGNPDTRSCSGPDCDPPLRGGVGIYRPLKPDWSKYVACTAGFVATKGTARMLLTAGHCTNWGGGWYAAYANHAPHLMGFVHTSTFPVSDIGAIEVASVKWLFQKPWVYKRAPLTHNEKYPITGSATAVIGTFVCKSGWAAGSSCGIVIGIDTWADYPSGAVFKLNAVWSKDGCAAKGDSGGPIYAQSKGYGILSGGGSGNKNCYHLWLYTPLDFVLPLLGMKLLTT